MQNDDSRTFQNFLDKFLPGFIYSFAKIASKTLVPSWNEALSQANDDNRVLFSMAHYFVDELHIQDPLIDISFC